MKEFALAHPFLTAFVCIWALDTVRISVSRIVRHLNVRAAGWPSGNLDADGDIVKPDPF